MVDSVVEFSRCMAFLALFLNHISGYEKWVCPFFFTRRKNGLDVQS